MRKLYFFLFFVTACNGGYVGNLDSEGNYFSSVLNTGIKKYQNPKNLYSGQSFDGYYKVGKPYRVDNKWYYPEVDNNYKKTGIASWYGDDFHNKMTANGEIFRKNTVSAGHKTLPLPSIVKVKNLENGKWIYVRVNDRGPFVDGREIDLSERAAKLLGLDQQGTAKVRVEFDKKATNAMFSHNSHASYDRDPKKAYPDNGYYKQAPKKGSSEGVRYFVQVGSYNSLDNANNALGQVNKLGDSVISIFESDVKKYYRVRVGPFENKDDANRKLSLIKNNGFSGAIIVSEQN